MPSTVPQRIALSSPSSSPAGPASASPIGISPTDVAQS